MAKPEYTRVRLNDTGAHVTVAVVSDGMTVLKQDAVDSSGRPLPDEPATTKKTSAAKPAASKTATASAASTTTTSGGNAADKS